MSPERLFCPQAVCCAVRRVVPDLDLLVREAQDDPLQETRS